MKVVAAKDFRDLKAGVQRRAGEDFEVDADRYAELKDAGVHGRLVWPVVDDELPVFKPKSKAKKQEAE